MISIKKPASKRPGVLRGEGCPAEIETEAAIAFYEVDANKEKPFEYAIYRNADVRAALEDIFHDKCAYCETHIGVGDEGDIEHWRPKGVVKQLDGERFRPGYFWLAADWDNLLLSCLRCNRPRRYRKAADEESKLEWETKGKGELFPLVDPKRIAKRRGQEADEKPLLLDPCRNKVESYLEVVVDRSNPDAVALITPHYKSGHRHQIAATSIRVFGLNREALVRARRMAMLGLVGKLDRLNFALDVAASAPNRALKERAATEVESSLDDVVAYLDGHAEYQLTVRTVLREYLVQNPNVARELRRALRNAG